jgi:hypothetical protein
VAELAPNNTDAMNARTVRAAPANADRKGTASAPRPGSSAMRIPTALGNAVAALQTWRMPPGRRLGVTPPLARRRVVNQIDTAAAVTGRSITTTMPMASAARSMSTPGDHSPMRTGPSGNIGDTATAIAARNAPAPATAAARREPSTTSWSVDMPIAPQCRRLGVVNDNEALERLRAHDETSERDEGGEAASETT